MKVAKPQKKGASERYPLDGTEEEPAGGHRFAAAACGVPSQLDKYALCAYVVRSRQARFQQAEAEAEAQKLSIVLIVNVDNKTTSAIFTCHEHEHERPPTTPDQERLAVQRRSAPDHKGRPQEGREPEE